MDYNIYPDPAIRDTSIDYQTGWINKGLILDIYGNPAHDTWGLSGYGLGALDGVFRNIPKVGKREIKLALADPETRHKVVDLMRKGDPGDALVKQFELDIGEYVNPTGKVIVFKNAVNKLGPRVKAAQEAMIDAVPTPGNTSPEAEDALDIAEIADNPQEALTHYYTSIGMEALVPEWFEEEFQGIAGYDDEDEVMEDVEDGNLGITKKAKKIMKGVAIGIAVAAAVVITAGVILPAVGAALPAIVGVVGTVGSAIFKPGPGGGGSAEADVPWDPSIPPGEPGGPPVTQGSGGSAPASGSGGIDYGALASTVAQIYVLKRSDPGRAAQAEAQTIEYLVSNGMGQAEAASMIADMYGKLAAQRGESAPSQQVHVTSSGAPGPSYMNPGYTEESGEAAPIQAGMGTGTMVALAAAAVLILPKIMGGGGGRRRRSYRRNPGRHRRSVRRRRRSA